MSKSQWSFKTAVELAAALKAKKVSAVELTQDAIAYSAQLSAEARKLTVEAYRKAAVGA